MFNFKNKTQGFTLIELLVVISIISLLSTVVLASLNSVRVKARDAERAANIDSIYKALLMFYHDHGCLPVTSGSSCITGYSQSDYGGWDTSDLGNGFMTFLQSAGYLSSVPVDPINDSNYRFRYFCYLPHVSYDRVGLHLGYYRERGGYLNKASGGLVWGTADWADPSFKCK